MRGQGGGQKHSPGCFISAYRNQCNLLAYSLHLSLAIFTVFSLNFSSGGKEPFMASKAKNAAGPHFPGGRGLWSDGHGPALTWKFRSQVP